MTVMKNEICIKCGSSNITLDKEKSVCGDCGLVFCMFKGNGEYS